MAEKATPSGVATIEILVSLGNSLDKEATQSSSPSLERCSDLILALTQYQVMSVTLLRQSKIGKVLTRSIKSFKRHKRTSSSNDWTSCISRAENLLQSWKKSANIESKELAMKNEESAGKDNAGSLPETINAYKSRLLSRKKELYKDPPVLPPPTIEINPQKCPPPTRDAKKALTFTGPPSLKILSSFHPNLTPEEILRGGAFGGTYFRPIHSAVTNINYDPKHVLDTTVSPEWIKGLVTRKVLISSTYDTTVNKFGVKCGGSLGMWESSGWIADCDPYGWFQWYCRFYSGRRCDDDERQIGRWMKCAGERGRFLSQLCNKILKSGKAAGDESISPVIRQTLWHWGLRMDEFILDRHRRRINA